MSQTWRDLLFAQWPLDVRELQEAVPEPLTLDTFEGQAWLGVVPFRMTGIRLRGLPEMPGLSALPELNLRTYVTDGAKPGVLFFSLDAGSPAVVAVARAWYHLPYYRARMAVRQEGDWTTYSSVRTHLGAPPARFLARYRPAGPPFGAEPGTLEHWLTERYCLYAAASRGRVYRAEVHHLQWPLQPAEARIETNTLPQAHGLSLPDAPPLLHFARRLDVVAWTPERVR